MARVLLIECALGVVQLDVDEEFTELMDGLDLAATPDLGLALPLLLSADRHGSRIVAVVDRRPPLVLSDDAGATWREAGGGLPPGRAVAISRDHPDVIAFVSESRVYVSENGGLFWRALSTELPGISRVAWSASSEGASDVRSR
jgi:hypothetical protein